ncbi:MAG TPA: hypothetical protein VFK32_00685, partial [Tepidiformaceae bacterium]|nr:hypothetical protein [Tepidiformaceae bacterium]
SASFLLAHVLALCLDPVVDFSPQTVVMPLTSEYRPVQVALGSVALLLLAVVLASTALAARFSYHAWHRIHLLSFPAFTLALTHGLTAGTDTAHPFATAIYAATAASIVMLLVLRVAGPAWVGSSEPIRP